MTQNFEFYLIMAKLSQEVPPSDPTMEITLSALINAILFNAAPNSVGFKNFLWSGPSESSLEHRPENNATLGPAE